jgi:hypothetical protein
MAIKYKEIKNKLETDPLIESELVLIDQAEKYIDEQIVAQFGNSYSYGKISIDLCIARFNYSPVTKTTLSGIKEPRRNLMFKELERRYKQAGWETKFEMDTEGGMNSADYWTLKGKS